MSGMNAVTTVVASLIVIIFVVVFMIFVPSYMGIRFERRRIAAQKNRTSMNWPFPAQQEQGQHQQPKHESDIEMNDWPLRYPEAVLTRRPSDWPLRRMEPVVMSERRRESVKNVGSESGSARGDLEGFPYHVR
ncbi:uncharacterized protein EAE97_005653 [Botrytis byssoidea]|uniref:Uncharacterized protein n=1 Tax=Botrytis byssoidea TaxID=139641 RepID=A0A9P5LUN3_9HELO|nr:uncharacterized protein EAE97_005653 [Botrytis byssoidea]KAF7943582.1 hypothetical protein EAE97_005653 [Botrytis byssoidea]